MVRYYLKHAAATSLIYEYINDYYYFIIMWNVIIFSLGPYFINLLGLDMFYLKTSLGKK